MAQNDLSRRDFFEQLIYESAGGRRFTQDSPVLPDVWIGYGLRPDEPQDLLLTPAHGCTPGDLAVALEARIAEEVDGTFQQAFLEKIARRKIKSEPPQVAYNESSVVVRLWFHELIRLALPLTKWWDKYLVRDQKTPYLARLGETAERTRIAGLLESALHERDYDAQRGEFTRSMLWMVRVVGVLGIATNLRTSKPPQISTLERARRDDGRMVKAVLDLATRMKPPPEDQEPTLWRVSRNRPASAAMYRSVPAIKADAARRLFEVTGKPIRWAVIDSGIDATHFAFRKRNEDGKAEPDPFEKKAGGRRQRGATRWTNNTRIIATYDFTRIRGLLSGDERTWEKLTPEIRERLKENGLENTLKRSLQTGRIIDWELLEGALLVPHDGDYEKEQIPRSEHGTHVAGILGADWRSEDSDDDALTPIPGQIAKPSFRLGVCPEIQMYDLRVLGEDGTGDEFSVMAALQWVRSLNGRRDYVEIHGVNVSLSLYHEVSNYACGRTPVCDECERLVGSGVVVVAAAGNDGRARYLTQEGDEEGYRSISVTDPGNAEAVITVGSTHRNKPHTYGVSYFSSRGPTGDGRIKPDLVAPGEKVRSTFPKQREEYLDGTSMAAPHVSGGAALLMSRYPELIGEPERIKRLLCDTATDLGRERYFQGAGMLDVLRALQST